MDKILIKLLRGVFAISKRMIEDVARVYEVDSDGFTLYYWNSSNNSAINHREVLGMIADEVEAGAMSGSVCDPMSMAEIMFEIKEK